MKEQLIILAPQLKTSSEEVSKLMKILAKEQIEIDKVRIIVAADEAVAKVFFIVLKTVLKVISKYNIILYPNIISKKLKSIGKS